MAPAFPAPACGLSVQMYLAVQAVFSDTVPAKPDLSAVAAPVVRLKALESA